MGGKRLKLIDWKLASDSRGFENWNRRNFAHGLEHLRRRHYLADVPLRMVGHMNERAPNRRRHLLAPDSAEGIHVFASQRSHPLCRIAE
jgi:hypothetical protein